MSCCDFYKKMNIFQKIKFNFEAGKLVFRMRYGRDKPDDGTTGALSKKKRKQLYERRLKMEANKRSE